MNDLVPALLPRPRSGPLRVLPRRAIVSTLALFATLALPAITLAASPDPSGAAGADTRSAGQGPGLVGAPGQAILLVVAIGVVAVALTLVYVRITTPREPPRV